MKDMNHHRLHVQKKVLQSSRKNPNNNNGVNGKQLQNPPTVASSQGLTSEKKIDQNHRVPPIPTRSSVH